MATVDTAWKKTDGPVRYFGGTVTAQLGDRVALRGVFRKRRGALNYVPGISPPHEEMEHNALYWVGVALENGTFTGVLVNPDTGEILRQVVFLERGSADQVDSIPPAPFE